MIQDIEPYIFSNDYKPQPPTQSSYILYFEEQNVLLTNTNNHIDFPCFSDLESVNADLYNSSVYLFSINSLNFYTVSHLSYDAASTFHMKNIRIFRSASPKHLCFAGITAFQLYNWYQNHQYCGRCGKKTTHDVKERMLVCPKCQSTEYPKISPAVIVGVTHGDKLLMSHYANRPYKNFALLAGFTEIGESIEETVAREVFEEVGVRVKNITYYKSQPWAFSDTLLLGFFAELDGDPTITLDTEELADADWFSREDIPDDTAFLSLTSEMMMHFKNKESATPS